METTAVASLSENDGNAAQDNSSVGPFTEELGTLEREEPTKLTARNRALKKLPLLVLYGIACFSLAFVAPYIPHLVCRTCSRLDAAAYLMQPHTLSEPPYTREGI